MMNHRESTNRFTQDRNNIHYWKSKEIFYVSKWRVQVCSIKISCYDIGFYDIKSDKETLKS